MNGVKLIAGTNDVCNIPMRPYDDIVCSFMEVLSEYLMNDKKAKMYPDVISLAFWCRRSNVVRMKKLYQGKLSRLGRGLAFHIAPANVPVNFAFSFLFSLLAGNANIVRIPSKYFPQVDIICQAIESTLASFPDLFKRNAFVQYPSGHDATKMFSAEADARIIWGGDNTIEAIRSMPAKPRCVDISFADRYSVCIINGEKVLAADDIAIKKLAEGFYNDTFLMDQNACSSPQTVFWINDKKEARTRFWEAVYKVAEQKYIVQPASAVDKYVQLCEDAIDIEKMSGCMQQDNLLYRIEINALPQDFTVCRGKCGYFYEYSLSNFEELYPLINEKFQTLTYFGMDVDLLRNSVIENKFRGIDRIVPVGTAMDIGIIWDGYNVVEMLSRIVDFK